MIVAKIYWNTDHEGKPVDNVELSWEDMPQCWYGPFETEAEAAIWLTEWPDDDEDVFEMAVAEVPDDSEHVNDAEEYRGGKFIKLDPLVNGGTL